MKASRRCRILVRCALRSRLRHGFQGLRDGAFAPAAPWNDEVGDVLKTQKPRPDGNAALPDTHGASLRETCETYGLRYARPDPERRAVAMSASHPVLKAHRYRWVIETLSKSKFAGFLSGKIR
ncbi:hypothetical protein MPLB_1200147 [Mesorhizobium sp. ORS 3324]|nr:hypothetical protein MPLB_1200147 [Mesorhizobium sp. ORS 3324]